jgi:tetratricopeptide (TPR) repeat protein
LGQFNRAVEFYSYSLAADSTFANAVLNRANAYFNLVQYKDAIADYRHYLEIEPNTDQREMILRLIALLEEELVLQEEEKQRLAAEQEKIREEEARIAAEMAKYEEVRRQEEAARRAEEERIAAENAALEAERKAQEEERRRKLLEEVASALNESTRNVDLAFLAERRRSIYSLDEIFLVNEGSLNYEELLVEKNYKEKTAYEDVRIIFQQAIDRLPPEEKVLIDMYYNQDMNKKDIAKAMVSTQMSIARKLKKAFEMIAELVFEHQTGLDEIIVEEEAIDGDA